MMKSLILRTISLFMAVAVLFSSIGYGVFEHTCNFTQKKSIAFSSQDHCCSDDTPTNENSFKKVACCSLTKTLAKVNVNNLSLKTFAFDINLFASPVSLSAFSYLAVIAVVRLTAVNWANAPPVPTKTFLALIQTYLI